MSASLSGGSHWKSWSKQSDVDVGAGLGAVVGDGLGAKVGDGLGAVVGDGLGACVGAGEGAVVGDVVGALEGLAIKSNSQHTTDSTLCIPCAAAE